MVERWIFVLNKFVGAAHPTFIQLHDGTVHYFWTVGFSARDREFMGVYYQSPDGDTYHIPCDVDGFEAVSLGDRIVFAYTDRSARREVFVRVVEAGAVGPASSIMLWSSPYGTDGEHLFLEKVDGDRLWLIDTFGLGKVYVLKLAYENRKPRPS